MLTPKHAYSVTTKDAQTGHYAIAYAVTLLAAVAEVDRSLGLYPAAHVTLATL